MTNRVIKSAEMSITKPETRSDEDVWLDDEHTGTQPVHMMYSQNMDFSTFPLLLEKVYADLETKNAYLRNEMPFCAFQHVFTGILNATLIDHVRTVNAEDRYADKESPMNLVSQDMIIPNQIKEYLSLITTTTTPQGDIVKVNVPDSCIPKPRSEAAGNIPALPAGGFGICGADNHNAYECYVSPLVTSRYVEATIAQNTAKRFGAWQPLPDAMMPVGAIPTQNLLGYRPNVEKLNAEGLQAISNPAFPDGPGMAARLKWSSLLLFRVNGTLKKMAERYKMFVGRPTSGPNSAGVGWIRVDMVGDRSHGQTSARLSAICAPVHSSIALGSAQCNIVQLMGLKRERTHDAPGLCYVTPNHGALPGWCATINRNFEMIEPFAAEIGVDAPGLRISSHTRASPLGDRSLDIVTWIRKNFTIPDQNETKIKEMVVYNPRSYM